MTKQQAKLYFILAAVLFYVAGIITLLTSNHASNTIGWMFIVLGSMQLTLLATLKDKDI